MTTPSTTDLRLEITQVLLERADFRHRDDFLETKPKSPTSHVDISVNVALTEDGKGAAVRLMASCDAPEANYLFSVTYLILYRFEGASEENLEQRLSVTGATMLQPYVRELVNNLSSRGRFGPIFLNPVNFSDLFQKQLVEAREQKRSTTKESEGVADKP